MDSNHLQSSQDLLYTKSTWVIPGRLLTAFAHCNMEGRVGFAPTVLLLCRQLHWASLPPTHNLVVIAGNDPACEAYETPAYPSMLYHHM